MDKQILSLIHDQINYELYSSYMYFAIEYYYADRNLNGFANWFHVQTLEELDHANLLCQYLDNNGQKVELQSINSANIKADTHKAPIKLAYEHEKQVTKRLHHIYDVALEQKDFRTTQLLDWFIKEQGEEEKSANDLLAKMDLFGDDPKSLYLLDNELAARVYAPPTLTL